jgi:hypothetical protein
MHYDRFAKDVAESSVRDAVRLLQCCIAKIDIGMKPTCFGQHSYGGIESDCGIAFLA